MSDQKSKSMQPAGAVYSLDELCHAEKRLGARSDVIRAALLEQGVREATAGQAQKIVQEFKERQVK